MGWTINNKPLDELGVTVAGWGESAGMEVQELTLNTAVDSYADEVPAELVHGAAVVLRLDSQVMYQGKVKANPRTVSGSADNMSYTVVDAWDELDHTPYQQVRDYVTNVVTLNDHEDSIITTQPELTGDVEWEADVPLGERIREIISYAASVGVSIQIGNVIDGITWYRSQYKDMSCGALIRDMMALMPERVLWLDNRAATPTMHMRKRSDVPATSYDLSEGTRVTGHSITKHESEKVPGVAIRYEKPVPINTGNYTSLTQDIAGDVSGVGALIESVSLQAGQHQAEYARSVCEDIPQLDASQADILAMWVKYTPELAAIADIHTVDTVTSVLRLPLADKLDDNVQKYDLKIINDGVARPEQINPNAAPISRTDDVADYKRLLVEGTVPEWAGKRWSMIRATATIALEKTTLDAIGNARLKKQFSEIFNLQKTYDDKVYMTANFTGEMMATNAQSGNYKRVVTFDQGEPVPVGIAAQLLAQINTDRHSGSFALIGDDIDVAVRPGQRVNFTGKKAEWAAINEQVLNVYHDVDNGLTAVEYGPAQQLGAVDYKDRIRAKNKNGYSHGLRSNKPVIDGVGGSAATPVFKFARVSGCGSDAAPHPWQVTITKDDGAGGYKALVNVESFVVKSLTNPEKYDVNLSEAVTVTGADYLVLEYDVAKAGMDDALSVKAVPKDGYEAIVTETTDGTTTHLFSRVVLASLETSDGAVKIKDQLARNHFYQTFICTFGGRFAYFRSL